jgi:hypothetical protein
VHLTSPLPPRIERYCLALKRVLWIGNRLVVIIRRLVAIEDAMRVLANSRPYRFKRVRESDHAYRLHQIAVMRHE